MNWERKIANFRIRWAVFWVRVLLKFHNWLIDNKETITNVLAALIGAGILALLYFLIYSGIQAILIAAHFIR